MIGHRKEIRKLTFRALGIVGSVWFTYRKMELSYWFLQTKWLTNDKREIVLNSVTIWSVAYLGFFSVKHDVDIKAF